MATEADATSPEISPEVVGRAFVSQFYKILHHSPEHVYRFYNDPSTMSRPDSTGKLVTATSMNIKDLIHSLDWANYNVEILTLDTQASYKKGVTVLVTGCLTGQDIVRRKFIESFFLAPQNIGYFVLNNTFRFIDEVPVKDLVEEHCNEIAPTAPISPLSAVALLQEVAEIPDDSLGKNTGVVEDIEETTEVPVNQQISSSVGKVVPQSSTDSSHNVQPDVKASSNGNVDAPKKSYASLLMNGKQGTSVLPNHALAKPLKRNIALKSVRPGGQQTQAATLPTVATSTAATKFSAAIGNNSNASGNGHASSNGHVAGKGYSIYIGHLPCDATPKLVEQEFKKFGCIKKNGIQVRSNQGYVFGFVEYADASAQENALKMGTIQIGDREVQIEEKKTDVRVDGYTAGRGGYHNNGYRQGNYSNGRGYAGNDYAKRGGEAPPRGRGNGNGYVYENSGGRGARQGGGPK